MQKKNKKTVRKTATLPVKNSLIAAMQTKDTFTANGAVSHSTTGSAVLDFWSKSGAQRASSEQEIINYFSSAYSEDKNLALKALFNAGDIRGGAGERRLFRVVFNWLAKNDEKIAKKLIKHVPEYRRFDDLGESLENTPLEIDALKFVAAQLRKDLDADAPSLAGKWAWSEQASSDTTKRLAAKLRNHMKLSPRAYRKMLSGLRKKINVVETLMCSGKWTKINFSQVPSRAAMIYKSAFNKHTPELYSKFLTKVEKGEVKINSGVLYPYDLAIRILGSEGNDARTLEAQWKALPDYCEGKYGNLLVLADTSSSMGTFGTSYSGAVSPITACVSLALYIAERNTGDFKDYFLNFNDDSKLIKVAGKSLKDRLNNLADAPWGGSTNLQSAFDSILKFAVDNKVPHKDMPQKLAVLSDMEFNVACGGNNKTNFEVIKAKYKKFGYKMPEIIFWNLNSGDQTPVKFDENGTALVSGYSPSILKTVLSGKVTTPYDLMLLALNSERYEPITA